MSNKAENPATDFDDVENVTTKENSNQTCEDNKLNVSAQVTYCPSKMKYETNKIHPLEENSVEVLEIEEEKPKEKENCVLMYQKDFVDSDEDKSGVLETVSIHFENSQNNSVETVLTNEKRSKHLESRQKKNESLKYKPLQENKFKVLEIEKKKQKEKERCVTMYPRESLDGDEDEIIVVETVFVNLENSQNDSVETLKPSEERSNKESDQTKNESIKYKTNKILEDEIVVLETDFVNLENSQTKNETSKSRDKDRKSRSECQKIKDRNELKIVRKGSANDMFYRQSIEQEIFKIDEEPLLTFDILTKIVKEHQQSLCISLMYIPRLIVNIIFIFCDACRDENSTFLIYTRLSGIYHIILTGLYFFLVLRSTNF